MSSVTRFLRQIPTGLNYGVGDVTLALDFVPTSGNYVGNYPPGVVVPGSTTGLLSAITNAGADVAPFIRDMGKTIFAPYVATPSTPITSSTPYGYFRQYQALVPTPITATQGFIGGNGGNTFGVVGPSASTAGTSTYLTFYLPVAVGGVGDASGTIGIINVYPANGGQM
jgi:hypothetical protein